MQGESLPSKLDRVSNDMTKTLPHLGAPQIARLRVTMDHVEPKVLRRIDVPLTMKLDRLHQTLQAALGWTNSHLYEFRAGDIGWGQPGPYWPDDGPLDARKVTLLDVIEDTGVKALDYLYDFGDGWQHTIEIECLVDPEPDALYPRLIEATGRCPPEDVGGPWGYAEMLQALGDEKHERHAEFTEWFEDGFDPNEFDPETLEAGVAALAKHWSRKPAAKKARPA